MHLSFADTGTASRRDYAAWLLLLAGLLVLVVPLARPGGMLLAVAGALFGAIVAKLRAETVRRLADAAWAAAGRQGWAAVLVVTMFVAPVLAAITGPGPLTSMGAFTLALLVLAPLVAAAASASAFAFAVERPTSGTSGLVLAMVIILLGTGLGYAVASWSDDEAAAHRRRIENLQQFMPPPDPFANEAGPLHP